MLNSVQLFKRNLFKKAVSFLCLALMVFLHFTLPAQASEIYVKQDSDNIKNIFIEGVSKACLVVGGASAVGGTFLGGYGSIAFISVAGVHGLGAAGITSGLATIGSIVGGGMAAGVMVSAALPVLTAVAVGTVGCLGADFVSKNLSGENL